MTFKYLLAAALTLLTSLHASAGPFGLEMGMNIDQLRAVGVDLATPKDGMYRTVRVPRPHSAFESYALHVDEKLGLCRIMAIGVDIPMNSFGSEVKTDYSTLLTSLEQVYGPAKKFDYLMSGSLWKESKDWAMSLHQKERKLAAFWDPSERGFIPKDRVVGVALEAFALSTAVAYFQLTYEFDNATECVKRRAAKKTSVL